ncbi:hypothetical protein LOD99_6040 [Oopsacas minuta]|uniref:RanBP2-type domain-containing protein n=1 Tax=Oopsacas minuta TaxID=111878 RepID=A0AAV7JNS9_9METZ|nr:hypothetical protein LOD99_6040 [Oopsacas minuta]
MEDFVKTFKSVRTIPNLVPSRETVLPPELHRKAKYLVNSKTHEYKILKIYEIIISNLRSGKSILDIKQGLYSISKYPLCLFLDQDRPEFHQIRTFSGYYTYEIKEKLENFGQILEALGYYYDESSQLYKLDNEFRQNPGFDETIAIIGCELLLACEELDLFLEMSKTLQTDPVLHFQSLHGFTPTPNYKPQADNYQPYDQITGNPPVDPYPPQQQRQDAQLRNHMYGDVDHKQMRGRSLPPTPGSVGLAEVDVKPALTKNVCDQGRYDIISQNIEHKNRVSGLPEQKSLDPFPNVLDNEGAKAHSGNQGIYQPQQNNPQVIEPGQGRGPMVNPKYLQEPLGGGGYDPRDINRPPPASQEYTQGDVSRLSMEHPGHPYISPDPQVYNYRDPHQLRMENQSHSQISGNQGYDQRDASQIRMENQSRAQLPGNHVYDQRDISRIPMENQSRTQLPGNHVYDQRDASQIRMENQSRPQLPAKPVYDQRGVSQIRMENQSRPQQLGNQVYDQRDASQIRMENQSHLQLPGNQVYDQRDASQMRMENQRHPQMPGSQVYDQRDASQIRMENQRHPQMPGSQVYDQRDASQIRMENQRHPQMPGSQVYDQRDASQIRMENQRNPQVSEHQGYDQRESNEAYMANRSQSQTTNNPQSNEQLDAINSPRFQSIINQGKIEQQQAPILPKPDGMPDHLLNNFDDYKDMPVHNAIHSQTPRGIGSRSTGSPAQALDKVQESPGRTSPQGEGDPFRSEAFYRHGSVSLHDTQKRVSQEQQLHSDVKEPEGPTRNLSDKQKELSDKQIEPPQQSYGESRMHQEDRTQMPRPLGFDEPLRHSDRPQDIQHRIQNMHLSQTDPRHQYEQSNQPQNYYKDQQYMYHEQHIDPGVDPKRYDPYHGQHGNPGVDPNRYDLYHGQHGNPGVDPKGYDPYHGQHGNPGVDPKGYDPYHGQHGDPGVDPKGYDPYHGQHGNPGVDPKGYDPYHGQHGNPGVDPKGYDPYYGQHVDPGVDPKRYDPYHGQHGNPGVDPNRYDLYHGQDIRHRPRQPSSHDFSKPVSARDFPGHDYQHELYSNPELRNFGPDQDRTSREQIDPVSPHDIPPHNEQITNPIGHRRREQPYDEYHQQQYAPYDQQQFPTHQQQFPTHQQQFPTHQQQFPTNQESFPTHQKFPTHQQQFPTHQESFPTHQHRANDIPWDCPHCTYKNNPHSKVCEICSKTPDFLLSPNSAVPQHKRMCETCKQLNSVDVKFCTSCGRNFFPDML